MRRLSKSQFGRAIEGKSVGATEGYVAPSSPGGRTIVIIVITALITTIGIGAGWLGGKVLSGRIGGAEDSAVSSDTSTPQPSLPNSRPAQSPPPAKPNSGVEDPPASRSEADSKTEQPALTPEPPPKAEASRETPPKVPRVDKEEEADTVTGEDPSKEIGRKALKKMEKETRRMRRILGNKNEQDQN